MLSGQGIVDSIFNDGNIIILPFKEEQVQPNGYDLTIGPWVIRYKAFGRQQRMTIDLSNVDMKQMFAEPQRMGTGSITFRPFERILCHTQEIIGTKDKYVMQISTRSTLARLGIDVCGSAGFGDVGFINKWTLELQNNTDMPISVPVGARVAQAYFEEVVGGTKMKYTGKYNQTGYGLWKPEDMLPKNIVSDWIGDD